MVIEIGAFFLLRGASTGLMQACEGVMKSSKPDSLSPADMPLAIFTQ